MQKIRYDAEQGTLWFQGSDNSWSALGITPETLDKWLEDNKIVLDRKLSEKRVFPAIDITRSGTRKEELLIDRATLSKTWMLRRVVNPMNAVEAMEFFSQKMASSKTNKDFFNSMNS